MADNKLIVRKRLGLYDIRELINKLQTFKGTISKYLDLRVKWQTKQFNIIVDSGVIRNHIILKVVEWLGILYREKKKPYLLVTILGEPVLYKDGIINLEIGLIQINIKKCSVIINFNILLLGQDKVILKII